VKRSENSVVERKHPPPEKNGGKEITMVGRLMPYVIWIKSDTLRMGVS
jgi:hypothetical protein